MSAYTYSIPFEELDDSQISALYDEAVMFNDKVVNIPDLNPETMRALLGDFYAGKNIPVKLDDMTEEQKAFYTEYSLPKITKVFSKKPKSASFMSKPKSLPARLTKLSPMKASLKLINIPQRSGIPSSVRNLVAPKIKEALTRNGRSDEVSDEMIRSVIRRKKSMRQSMYTPINL